MKNCDECGGECCKYITISFPELDIPLDELDRAWLQTRGTLYADGTWRIKSRCPYFTQQGRCLIYSERPQSCVDFEVGGKACRKSQERRITIAALTQKVEALEANVTELCAEQGKDHEEIQT